MLTGFAPVGLPPESLAVMAGIPRSYGREVTKGMLLSDHVNVIKGLE